MPKLGLALISLLFFKCVHGHGCGRPALPLTWGSASEQLFPADNADCAPIRMVLLFYCPEFRVEQAKFRAELRTAAAPLGCVTVHECRLARRLFTAMVRILIGGSEAAAVHFLGALRLFLRYLGTGYLHRTAAEGMPHEAKCFHPRAGLGLNRRFA